MLGLEKSKKEKKCMIKINVLEGRGQDHIDALFASLSLLDWQDMTVACIGTDRSTGDSLGPLVGTLLERACQDKGLPLPVVGTLASPLHAVNLSDRLSAEIHTSHVLAIDACLGAINAIGNVALYKGGLRPGAGVGKELPKVGDFSLTGIVNVGGFMEHFVLQNTRLHHVMTMADCIVTSIVKSASHQFAVQQLRQQYNAGM